MYTGRTSGRRQWLSNDSMRCVLTSFVMSLIKSTGEGESVSMLIDGELGALLGL